MKSKQPLIFVLAIITAMFFTACPGGNEPEFYSLVGKAQKGPFVQGTTVNINELNESLVQTGKSFTTTISNNDGSFNIKDMELESNFVLLTASGYYYNEVMGELSKSPITLSAIADLNLASTVNVNVFTHIIKDRIIKLVGEGKDFKDATATAQNEFLQFLGVETTEKEDFYELNLIGNTEYDAALLAFSIFVQKYSGHSDIVPQLYAMLTQLLSNLSQDFADNGKIDDGALIVELLENITTINFSYVKTRLEDKYKELGYNNIVLSDFEKYVVVFQQKYAEIIYHDFEYPEFAFPYEIQEGETDNLLYKEKSEYNGNRTCSFAAIVPFGKTLKIKYTHLSGDTGLGAGENQNWEVEYFNGGFVATALKQNLIISTFVELDSPINSESASGKFEYFEDSETPTFTKIITWK